MRAIERRREIIDPDRVELHLLQHRRHARLCP
jgi:hypothetical protein